MKCPFCSHLGDKVVDSRESKEGEAIRRRRECLECGKRFTSYERIDEIPYMVVKKDGSRERFERQKLVAGLLKACEKRPVSMAALEAVPATVTSMTPRRAGGQGRASDPPPRRRFRDNIPLILVGIGVLAAVLVAMIVAANRVRLAPELVTEFVLYALIAVDLTMLAALAFVLARNLVKVVVEQRRALPFARFRSKLVAVLML